MQVDI